MIICGCDNGTTVSLPNYRLNLRFAAAWETAMEDVYKRQLLEYVHCTKRNKHEDWLCPEE